MQILYAFTLLLSALLLFVVQPMFGKMVLPLLGGSPAVWNTCMVFYQAMLLLGYVYSHLTVRWLGPRRQALLHLLLLLLPWLVLPVGIGADQLPPRDGQPTLWLLGLLMLSVGLPFLVVSASAPMLQAWFAATGHRRSDDPYFLYAASNIGSLVALLSYPLLFEPNIVLAEQSRVWAGGYAVLSGLIAVCAVAMWRSGGARSGGKTATDNQRATKAAHSSGARPTWSQRGHWLLLALVPSSLLLGVTTHLSTDIAAVPLLWVIPLALYLLTFVFTFAQPPTLSHRWMLRLQPYLLVTLAVLFFSPVSGLFWLQLPLHLGTFFVTVMVCHGELAARRPAATYLTEFYLWMSLGGVLGGLLNAVVAPAMLHGVFEYPAMLAAACLLRPWSVGGRAWRDRLQSDALPAAVFGVGCIVLGFVLRLAGLDNNVLAVTLLLAIAATIGFGFQTRPIRMAGAVIGLFLLGALIGQHAGRTLHVERNFFGVVRVTKDPRSDVFSLMHGTTNHGLQIRRAGLIDEPMAYYHRSGPLGQLFAAYEQTGGEAKTPLRSKRAGTVGAARPRHIGVIGLGVGSIACYGRPGQRITFFEIDPAVERVARDPRYFTFLRDSAAEVEVVLGDARLRLVEVPDGQFDLLILDAFSSDAVPMHLVTREAMSLYRRKLAPDGVLALHLTNRYLDLDGVLANVAVDGGLTGLIQREHLDTMRPRPGKFPSTWIVLARDAEQLAALASDPRWRPLPVKPGQGVWTDDFTNILSVLRW